MQIEEKTDMGTDAFDGRVADDGSGLGYVEEGGAGVVVGNEAADTAGLHAVAAVGRTQG